MIFYEQPEAGKPGGLKNTINRIQLAEVVVYMYPEERNVGHVTSHPVLAYMR
jgi:hypothetical protein